MAIVNDFDPPHDFDPPRSDGLQALAAGLQPFRALLPSNTSDFPLATVEQTEAQVPLRRSRELVSSHCALYHPKEHISGAGERLL